MLVEATCAVFNVTWGDLLQKDRHFGNIREARSVLVYLLETEADFPRRNLRRLMDRDSSAFISMVKTQTASPSRFLSGVLKAYGFFNAFDPELVEDCGWVADGAYGTMHRSWWLKEINLRKQLKGGR